MLTITSPKQIPTHQRSLILFKAPWCGQCGPMARIIEQLEVEHCLQAFCVDIDASRDLASAHFVRSVPSLQLVEDGTTLARIDRPATRAEISVLFDKAKP